MLKITVRRDKDGKIVTYSAAGHCNYNEPGKDIVCSATSALLQTAVLGVYKERVDAKACIKRGGLKIDLPDDMKLKEKAKFQIIFEAIFLGLKEIEKQYPANVSITEVFEKEVEEEKVEIKE